MSVAITPKLLEEAMRLPETPRSGRNVPTLPTARPAGVLLPVRFGPRPHVVAMIRPRTMKEHAGEVGFPGGKCEPGETHLATALRETEEELGLPREKVAPLGGLQPVSVITGRFVIHPFVGAVADEARIVPCPSEVERLVELPLVPFLTGEKPYSAVEVRLAERTEPDGAFGHTPVYEGVLKLPHFELDGCVLYGASAYVFHELLVRIATVLGRELPEPRLEKELPWRGRYGTT